MNTALKTEEALMFAACLFAFTFLGMNWWWFIGCILLPDVGMLGYVHSNKTGAWTYNLLHHKGIAILVGLAGYLMANNWLVFAGLILFAHASMDRMFGYGLKYEKGFSFTHLGELGKDHS
ncbi:MAG TPA: DUF4260 domain-containing protein [Cyclobacteriaceae bacterium]|nr:DUF4260 domain-containing protein [Cyclobacteriaceae bacterium]